MMDSSRAVGNGFSYQEKLSSRLASVLEAVAGEYALVINGHSLVSIAMLSLGSTLPESTCLSAASRCALFSSSFPMEGGVPLLVSLCSRPTRWRQTWS